MSFNVISATENLPRFVARRISKGGGKDFSGSIVVFPTHRLCQHFRRELAAAGGACLSPRVMTLGAFIAGLLSPPEHRPVSSLERLLILRSLMEEGDFRHLGPGMEGVVADFFRELSDAGLVPDEENTFEKIEAAFRESSYGSESYAVYWREFSAELRVLAAAYRSRLDLMGLGETDWDLARISRTEIAFPEEKIFICGFYDATPIQLNVLKQLARRGEFIYQAEDSPAFAPVIRFADRLGHDLRPVLPRPLPVELGCLDSPRLTTLPPPGKERFRIFSLPSLTAEARQAKYETLKARAADKSVMVVVPRKPEYVSVFSAVFASPTSGRGDLLPHSNALARRCYEDPAVQLLQALLQLASTDFSSYALSGYLLTPGGALLVTEDEAVTARVIHRLRIFLAEEYLGSYRQVVSALKRWLRSRREEGDEELIFLPRLRELLEPFLEKGKSDFGALAARTLKLFDRCCRLFPPGNLEDAARARVRTSLRALAEAGDRLRLAGSAADFLALIKRYVFAADVYTTPEPLSGAQLVHILEARSVPAEVIILCGMNEGDFPASLPPRLIEEPVVREKLGLLTSENLEALEELNFFSLALQGKSVVLTRCPRALKEEEAESRFITRLRLSGCSPSPPVAAGSSRDNLLRSYRLGERSEEIERLKRRAENRKTKGFFPGLLPAVIPMSYSRCESFLNCPARFFLEFYGVEAAPQAVEEPDPLYEGTALHDVAAAAWKVCVSEKGEWERERLEELLRALGEKKFPKLEAFTYLSLMMECGGWRRFSRWLEELISRWRPARWEKKLRARVRCPGYTFELTGRADFIGRRREDGVIVVDLKRRNFPGRGEVKNFAKPQLPFYSLGLKAEKIGVSHLGYCSFLKKDHGYLEMEEEGLGDELRERLKEGADAIAEAGGFICRNEEKTCRYCPYPGVCRREEIETRE